MHVLLFCASPVQIIRERVATAAIDAGLTEVVPSCFQGKLTRYARERLLKVIMGGLGRKRPYHIELLTLPDEAFTHRFVRRRG